MIKFLDTLGIPASSSLPVSGTVGEILYFSGNFYGWTGSTWERFNNGTAATLSTGRTLAITGDLSWTSPSFNGSSNVTAAGTLATVNSNVGSFGSATAAPTFTVNGKGLITAASSATITPAFASITSKPTTLSGYGIVDATKSTSSSTPPSSPTIGDIWVDNVNGIVYVYFNDGTSSSWVQLGSSGVSYEPTPRTIGITGDLTWTSPTFDGSANVTAAGTLATVNSNVGSFGSATATPTFTVNAKGLITAAGSVTVTPSFASITSKPTTLSGYGITDAVATGGLAGSATILATGRTLGITGDLVWTSPSFNGSANVTAAGTIQANVVDNTKLGQVATQTFKGRTTAATGNVEDLTVAQAKTMLGLTGNNSGDQTITLTGDITGSGTGSFATTLATVNSNVGSFGSATAAPTFTVNAKGLLTAAGSVTITPAFSSITSRPTTLSGYGITDAAPINNPVFTGTVTLAADPVSALQAATKQYVDNVAQGLDTKASVLCATTTNITLSGEQTLDGVLTSASRVLVKNQTTTSQNGIYVSAAGSWTRAIDMDAWTEVAGSFVFIEQGTTQGDTGWVCISDATGTINTTAITWAQFSGAGSYSASGGITLTGTTFALTSMAANSIKGNNTGSSAAPIDLTATQTTAMLDLATGSLKGLMSSSDFTKLAGIAAGAQVGTVTSVSVTTANGISGSVATSTSTPAITLTLGAITPTTIVASGNISGLNLSGTNTGDQTTVSGNAGSATVLQTGRTIAMTGDVAWTSPSFNGSANISGVGATLATVNADIGTWGATTQIPVFTVNAKGLITAVTIASIGNSSSATVLQTGRTLGITGDLVWTSPSFNGSANVTAAGTIQANVVDNTKLAQVATQTFKGRTTAATGNVEDLTIAQAKTMLGLTGTNSGDQTITLTGDITGSGTGSFATTLATVNSNVGAFGAAQSIPTITVNAKGLVTAVSTTAIGNTVAYNIGTSGATVPLLNGSNTWGNTHTQSAGTAVTALDYIRWQPTDYGTGKPFLTVSKTTTANQWNFGLWDGTNNAGTIRISAGTVQISDALTATRIDAPVYYDSNDTAYWIDPSAGTSASLNGGITFAAANPTLSASSWMQFTGGIYLNGGTSYAQNTFNFRAGISNDTGASLVLNGGTAGWTQIQGSTRSPLFYDNDDTAFYLNPSLGSVLNTIALGGASATQQGVLWANGNIWMAGNGRKLAFSTDGSTDDGGNVSIFATGNDFIVNNWSGSSLNDNFWVYGAGRYTQAAGSIRAPLFYDIDNTGYYCDPASGNNFYGTTYINGGLLVGQTATTADINGANDVGSISVRGNGSYPASMSFHRTNTYAINMGLSTSNIFVIGGWSATSNAFQMDGSGNLTMTGNVTAYSDMRIKKNILTIENALDKVLRMRGVTFDRTDIVQKSSGVVAQEFELVAPELVMTDTQGIKSVAYGNALGYLIEAFKEQNEIINRQQAQIDQLILAMSKISTDNDNK